MKILCMAIVIFTMAFGANEKSVYFNPVPQVVAKEVPVKKSNVEKKIVSTEPVLEKEGIQYKVQDLGVGKVSWFGGPKDKEIAHSKVALYDKKAGKLNPNEYYCAIRYDPKLCRDKLRRAKVYITAKGKTIEAKLVDWGPHRRTGRLIDCSPGILDDLGIRTDQKAHVVIHIPLV